MNRDTNKRRMSPSDKGILMIMSIVIIVVLALGVWAVVPKLQEAAQNSGTTMQDTTIKGLAEERGMTTEEFKTEFGLDPSVTDDTDINDLFASMTVANAAKLLDMTTEEYLEQNSLTGVVTGDQTIQEAQDAFNQLTVAQVYGDDQETLSSIKETYGLTDDQVPETMTMAEFDALIQSIALEQSAQAAEETAAPEETAAADEGTAAAETAAPEETAAAE